MLSTYFNNCYYFAARCDLEIKNKKGETALMISAFYDYADIAQVLLKEGKHRIRHKHNLAYDNLMKTP